MLFVAGVVIALLPRRVAVPSAPQAWLLRLGVFRPRGQLTRMPDILIL